MGDIKKVLAQKIIEPRTITPESLWTDLCEDIHLHYRNIRFDFSQDEWAVFRAGIVNLGMAIEFVSLENKYEEGDPNFLMQQLFNTKLNCNSNYFPNRTTIELQRDNTIHFHYRDLRIHLSLTEYLAIAKMFNESLKKFKKINEFPYKVKKPTFFENVDINLIQPYDSGHEPLSENNGHRVGIEHVKYLIKSGKRIRPILVDQDGQRLDGFKRYMAQFELKQKTIDCIVTPYNIMGEQSNQPFTITEEEIQLLKEQNNE